MRGHHGCKDVRTPSIGERLQLANRTTKIMAIDHVVSVVMAETIVGHIRCHAHFGTSLGMVGVFGCEVTGRRMFGKGLKTAGGTFTIPILSM